MTYINYYDNLLRQGTEITGSYANAVVAAAPENAQTVVDDFQHMLNMMEGEISARI